MDSFKVPTDSLYKFCAIAGVVLLALTYVFIFHRQAESDLRRAHLRGEQVLARYEAQVHIDQANELFEELTKELGHDAAAKLFLVPGADDSPRHEGVHALTLAKEAIEATLVKAESIAPPKELVPEIERLYQDAKEIDLQEIRLQNTADELSVLEGSVLRNTILAGLGTGIGFTLLVLGIGSWYYKVQIHQDSILAKEAQSQE